MKNAQKQNKITTALEKPKESSSVLSSVVSTQKEQLSPEVVVFA